MLPYSTRKVLGKRVKGETNSKLLAQLESRSNALHHHEQVALV
jgi:hypothetical protein